MTQLPDRLSGLDRRSRAASPSHAQVQRERELGLNGKKLGKLDSHGQEP